MPCKLHSRLLLFSCFFLHDKRPVLMSLFQIIQLIIENSIIAL